MAKTYYQKENGRKRFWMRVPNTLWDCLPKVIKRELPQADTNEIVSRCQACGKRLKDLFDRALNGMVSRTILKELVIEICNEELHRKITTADMVEIRQPIPAQPDLLNSFLGQILKNLNISFKAPVPQEPPQAVPAVTLPVFNLNSVFSDNHVIPGAGFRAT